MNLDHISFPAPKWILNSYIIFTIVQFFANFFSVYLIVFKSSKIDTLRFYLLNFQILVAFSEIFITSFFKPIFLIPICALYSDGLAIRILKLSVHSCILICITFIAHQHYALALCFLRKHYTISKISNGFKLTKQMYIVLCVLAELTILAAIGLSINVVADRGDALAIIFEHFPKFYTNFKSLDSFAFYTPSSLLYFLFFLGGLGIASLFAICALLTFDMLRILRKNQHKLSKFNMSKQQTALKGLTAQLLATVVGLAPFAMLEFVVVFELDYGQTLFHILVNILCLHSTMYLIILITTYQPYRQFMKSLFIRKRTLEIFHVSSNTRSSNL